MTTYKSELFLKAYRSKRDQKLSGIRSKFVYLCSQLDLDPVTECGVWRAYITKDIYLETEDGDRIRLFDTLYRTYISKDVYPKWMGDCPDCCQHIYSVVPSYKTLELSSDLATLLEQVGEYLDGAPRDFPMPDDSYFRWIAKRHNGHLTLGEMLFGPKHGYYDLYPGLFRKLWDIFIGKAT